MSHQRTSLRKWRGKPWAERKCSQHMHVTMDSYPECLKNPCKLKEKDEPHWKMDKDLNINFPKEDKETADKHMKICSTLFNQPYLGNANWNHDEISLHIGLHGWNFFLNDNSRYWWGYGITETLVHCLWECKMVQWLLKMLWQFLTKLSTPLPDDPAIPLKHKAISFCIYWMQRLGNNCL